MLFEPGDKRVIAFVDGQNLFYSSKEAYGYSYPNYDPVCLAQAVAARQEKWHITQTRFYTGIPRSDRDPFWYHFWREKLKAMQEQRDTWVYFRPLVYTTHRMEGEDGVVREVAVGREKGVDVRMAIDIIDLARKGRYDVALLFTQDQDMAEVAEEIRSVARETRRWIKIASAYPSHPERPTRGVDKTDWLPFERETYDGCLDNTDYRPPLA